MNPTTSEWVEKAEKDFSSAGRELRARKAPNYDLACFCAQQCGEKYLKALLQETGRRVPRTHDLIQLVDLMLTDFAELALLSPRLKALTPFAITFRYPGSSASKNLARQAYLDCELIRESVRGLLKLPNRHSSSGPKRKRN